MPVLLVVLLPLLLSAQSSPPQKADYSGVDAFWNIRGKLKKSDVTTADWDTLFATPYYAFYANWGQRKYMQRILTTALDPQKSKSKDSLLLINDYQAVVIRHLMAIDSLQPVLQAFRQKLSQQDLMKNAVKRTKVYLPRRRIRKDNVVAGMAFGFFQPDANADESIAIDLKLAMGVDIVRLIAHELHHFYTLRLRVKFKEDKIDSTYLLLKTIGQLQLEGIADMIDKPYYLYTNGKGFTPQMFALYKSNYEDPLPKLKQVDAWIVQMARNPDSTRANSKRINELLPLAGHPHGYHMAMTIVKTGGKKALLSVIDNPFDFIRAYNSAIRKRTGQATFSEEAMAYLQQVEQTHLLN